MTNSLTKAFSRSRAFVASTRSQAQRLKAGGMLDMMVSPAAATFGFDWQSQTKARQTYSLFRSWVYAAVHALASEAACQPFQVARMKGAAARPGGVKSSLSASQARAARSALHRTKMLRATMTASPASKAADVELEVLKDHPLSGLMDHPNPIQHRYQFVYSFIANLNLTGRAYVVRDEEDGQERYYSLPTTWVRPDHSDGPYSKFFVINPRKQDFSGQTEPLDASQVAFAYMPNPADPLQALSPASSMDAAIRIDDRVQICQERFFDNSPFPSVVVTVGKNPHPDVGGDGVRPRLTASQRRQVVGAIKRVMASPQNFGTVAIVDGLIENISKFSQTQPEIGWERSEGALKTRILSAFGVHPFILGEPVAVGGYAQAYLIEERFCNRLNVFLDMLSVLMQGFLIEDREEEKARRKIQPSGGKVCCWWEKKIPRDPQREDANWSRARASGDVTQNEFRARLGLPPDEDGNEDAISAALAPQVIAALGALGQGAMTPEQAEALFTGMGLPDELARRLSEPPEEPEPAPAPPVPPAVPPGAEAGQEVEGEEGAVPPPIGGKPPKPGAAGEEESAEEAVEKAIRRLRTPPEVIADRIVRGLTG